MISVVTGYVPIPNHPRSAEEYHALGCKLLQIKHRVLFSKCELWQCWLYQFIKHNNLHPTHSIADNPIKNSLDYHIAQAQKTEWLAGAALIDDVADVFAWVDFGIFHVPGITVEIIDDFLDRADNERAITIPGCWPKDSYSYDDRWPCWRFCGGVMVVPRRFVETFNWAMKREYLRWLNETGNISWEVNTLARLEQRDEKFPVWWYAADHDQTLFTNYKAPTQHENLH